MIHTQLRYTGCACCGFDSMAEMLDCDSRVLLLFRALTSALRRSLSVLEKSSLDTVPFLYSVWLLLLRLLTVQYFDDDQRALVRCLQAHSPSAASASLLWRTLDRYIHGFEYADETAEQTIINSWLLVQQFDDWLKCCVRYRTPECIDLAAWLVKPLQPWHRAQITEWSQRLKRFDGM